MWKAVKQLLVPQTTKEGGETKIQDIAREMKSERRFRRAARKGKRLFGLGRACTQEGNHASVLTEIPLPDGITISHVAPGHDNTLLLDTEGRVYTFGMTPELLGLNGEGVTKVTLMPSFELKAVHTAVGIYQNLVALEDGSVWSWGSGGGGPDSLGYADKAGSSLVPRRVDVLPSGTKAILVAASGNYSAVAAVGGKIYCFGLSQFMELQLPDGQEAIQMVMSRSTPFVLTDQNKLYTIRTYSTTHLVHCQAPELESKCITKIAASDTDALVLVGLPKWSIETHSDYPTEFHDLVKTIMLIRTLNADKEPNHPECLLWKIPIEIVLFILAEASDTYSAGGVECFSVSVDSVSRVANLEHLSLADAARGYSHDVLLTVEGEIYATSPPWEGGGEVTPEGLYRFTSPTPMKSVYAGYYADFCLAD